MRELHPDEMRFIELTGNVDFDTLAVGSSIEAFRLELFRLSRAPLAGPPPMAPATASERRILEPLSAAGAHAMTLMAMLAFLRAYPAEARGIIRRATAVLRRRQVSMRPLPRLEHSDGDRGFSVISA